MYFTIASKTDRFFKEGRKASQASNRAKKLIKDSDISLSFY